MSEGGSSGTVRGVVRYLLALGPIVDGWNRSPLAERFGETTTAGVYLPVLGAILAVLAPSIPMTVAGPLWLGGIGAVLAHPVAYVWNRSPLGSIVGEQSGWEAYLLLLGVLFVVLVPIWATGITLPLQVFGVVALLSQPAAFLWNRSGLGGYFGGLTAWQLFGLAGGFGFILFAPYLETGMDRSLALAGIWAIFAMGWDIQSGYTGYISFGHSALSGVAGYTVGLLTMHTGVLPVGGGKAAITANLPTILTGTALAIVATLAFALVLGAITLRLRGPYFSLITLVAVLLFTRLVIAFSEYTNGLNPIGAAQDLMPYTFDAFPRYYFVVFPLLVIAVALTVISRSNVGLILTVIRENESAVSAAGISPTRFKLWSFVISGVPMAIGGVLLAYFDGRVDPQTFVIVTNSIEMIAIAVIGGLASVLGPLFAAFAFIPLEETILPAYLEPGQRTWALWTIVILVLVFARNGVFRLLWQALGRVGGDEE